MLFVSKLGKSVENLRVSTKIVLAFAALFATTVGLGGIASDRLAKMDSAAAEIRSHWLPRTQGLGELLFLAQRFRVIEAALVMAPREERAAEAKTIAEIKAQVAKGLAGQRNLATNDGERAELATIAKTWSEYLDLDQQLGDFVQTDGGGAAADLYRGAMRELIHVLQGELSKAVSGNVAHGDAATDRGVAIGVSARRDLMLMSAGAVAACAAIGFALWRGISRPIGALTAAMTALAQGERDVEIPALDLGNEIGAMARAAKVFGDDSLARREKLSHEVEAQRIAADAERQCAADERSKTHAELDRAMQGLGEALKRLAAGDLAQKVDDGFSSDYAAIRDDLDSAILRLRETMLAVIECSDAIRIGVQEIADASDELSLRTDEQAASLQKTSTALDQIAGAARKAAGAALHARDVVAAANEAAKRNEAVVSQAVDAMDGISKSATHINRIIGVIDEIAFQTNLLALNAGVEAARAGDSGKGFAVVAAEVRALALRSAGAAKEIKTLISESSAQVENGVKLVGESGAALARISKDVSNVNDIINEIAAGAREQTSALDSVGEAVGKMDRTTEQNAAMVEQSNAATQSLSREAGRLVELVGRFDVGVARREAASAMKPSPRPAAKTAPRKAQAAPPPRRAAARAGRDDWAEF